MTWSKDNMRRVVSDRGEETPEPFVELALLAHERMCGRTEENYPSDTAKQEFEGLIQRMTEKPRIPGNSYIGMKQLQQQSGQMIAARQSSQTHASETPTAPIKKMISSILKDRELER